MQQIYRRTPIPKCDFHVDAKGYLLNLDPDPDKPGPEKQGPKKLER